ncbi:MAG: hypothetical protein U0Q15_17630 [Kineosporiaceae bacterium]
MRWEDLFDDLEAQLAAQRREGDEAELADVIRAERGRLEWADRLRAQPDQVAVMVEGGRLVGRVVDGGPDWVLLRDGRRVPGGAADPYESWGTGPGEGAPGSRDVVVPLGAVIAVSGLRAGAAPLQGVARRLGLAAVLRGLCRDRVAVRLGLRDGAQLVGTPASVGADHVDLRCHDGDDPRARGMSWTVPFDALTSVSLLG